MPSYVDGLSDDNLPEIPQILTVNPLEDITLVADCSQLRKYCDGKLLREQGSIKAIFFVRAKL